MNDLTTILAEATPGPWELDPHGLDKADVWHGEDHRICEDACIADARLIALAPQLAAVFAMIGQHAQRSVGGRDFYIAALVCVVIAGGAFAWSMY